MNTTPTLYRLFCKKITLFLFGLGLVFFQATLAHGVTMNIQDTYYSKTQDKYLNGTYSGVVFKLKTATAILFETTIPQVTFTNGYFEISVSVNATLFNRTLPIEAVLTVQGESMSFPLLSVPYAIRSTVAELARSIPISAIKGSFATVNVKNGISVRNLQNKSVFIAKKNTSVGILNGAPAFSLDIRGTVNATNLLVNKGDIRTIFSWKADATNPNNIYFKGGFVGINTNNPFFGLHVDGTINASTYLINGQKLSNSLDWKRNPTITPNVYYQDLEAFVGIGTAVPKEKVDVVGGLKLSIPKGIANTVGTIQWTGSVFKGYLLLPDNAIPTWRVFPGINGSGNTNKVALWSGQDLFAFPNNLSYSSLLRMDPTANAIGIGGLGTSKLDIFGTQLGRNLLSVIGSQAEPSLVVLPEGNIGIGVQTPAYKLQIAGVLDAQDFTVNGEILRLTYSVNDIWTRRPSSRSIYYLLNNIGIGRPDPKNLLEIAQPTGVPTQNPAITFTNTSTLVSYTLGVDTHSKNTFRIEKGIALGQSKPLFVAQEGRFGVGTDPPKANLHVSGNEGIVFSGTFLPLGTTSNYLPVSGPGTRLLWYPPRSALRIGTVSTANWNFNNQGLYTVGMGLNPLVEGNLSVAMGGAQNQVTGVYASSVGGFNNQAQGDFSLALGRNTQALHHGTWVWADNQNSPIGSVGENQVILRASGGVAIGTSNIQQTGLTLSRSAPTGSILSLVGNETVSFQVSSNGLIRIGSSPISSPSTGPPTKLSVLGDTGLGTLASYGMLGIQPASTFDTVMMIIGNQGVATPAMMVTKELGVYIGTTPSFRFVDLEHPDLQTNGFIRVASGSVLADSYTFPDGQQLSGDPPNYVWQYRNTTPNIYFVSGNVGIGTTTPRHLLHLSNMGSLAFEPPGLSPLITINLDDQDLYTFGISRTIPDRLIIQPSTMNAVNSPFSVWGNRVGIGTVFPKVALHVSGDVFVASRIRVGTPANASSLSVSGSIASNKFFIKGSVIAPGGTPWSSFISPSRLYYDTVLDPAKNLYSFVGIGTQIPRSALHVAGTLRLLGDTENLPFLRISKELYGNTVSQNEVALKDTSGSIYSSLYVTGNRLFLKGSIVWSISDVFSKGAGQYGNIALWVPLADQTTSYTLGDSALIWDSRQGSNPGKLLFEGDILSDITKTTPSSFLITNTTRIGNPTLLNVIDVQSSIDHNGALSNSKSHSGKRVMLTYDKDTEGGQSEGVSITLRQPPNASFTAGAQAIGLSVDSSGVAVQSFGDKGLNTAAVFLGKVGINTMTPSADLDVRGSILAKFFTISRQLTMSTLNVTNSLSIMSQNRVGIGTTTPKTDLEIVNSMQTNSLIASGIHTESLTVAPAFFSVNNFRVGIGTTTPVAQLHISRSFLDILPTEFSFQNLGVSINIATALQNCFGLDIAIRSASPAGLFPLPNNYLGSFDGTSKEAKGIAISLKNIIADQPFREITGLSITLPKQSTQNAAIFRGGFVGIGVSDPQTELDVAGTVSVDYFKNKLSSTLSSGAFDFLEVRSSTQNLRVTGPVVMENATVKDLIQQQLSVKKILYFKDKSLSINSALLSGRGNIVSTLSAQSMQVSTDIAVRGPAQLLSLSSGKDAFAPIGVAIIGKTQVASVSVSEALFANTVSINALFVMNKDRKLGIGTTAPRYGIDIQIPPSLTPIIGTPILFEANNNESWNAIRISQSQGNAVGLLAVSDTDSGFTSGSGVVAIKTGNSSSALSFLSDPDSGPPAEHMRITSSGNVGIDTSSPQSKLDINGDTIVRESGSVSNPVSVKTVSSPAGLSLLSSLILPTDSSVTGYGASEQSIELRPTTPDVAATGILSLFVREKDNSLYFQTLSSSGHSVSENLSIPITSSAWGLATYSTKNRLASAKSLQWVPSTTSPNILKVNSLVSLMGGPGTASGKNNAVSSALYMTINDRTKPSTARFTGTTIVLGNSQAGPLPYVGTNQTAVGIGVDMDRLKEAGTTSQGLSTLSKKIAAVFLSGSQTSGNVGIATSPNSTSVMDPMAALHVRSDSPTQSLFLLQAQDTTGKKDPLLIVLPTGNVGIGTATPGSKLSILSADTTQSSLAFLVLNNQEKPLFALTNEGQLGIGRLKPAAGLQLTGTLRSTTFHSHTLSLPSLRLGDYFSVDASGIGMGIYPPKADWHIIRSFVRPSKAVFLEKIALAIPANTGINANIAGLQYATKSKLANTFGSLQNTPIDNRGMGISLEKMELAPNGILTGLYVTVSANNSQNENPRWTAAYLGGGKVGIGTSTPEMTLDINGDLRARSIYADNSLFNVPTAKLISMAVRKNAPFLGDAYVSGNVLTVSKILSIENTTSLTLLFSDPTHKILESNQLLRAIDATVPALSVGVVGRPQDQFPPDTSRRLYTKGDVKITNGKFDAGLALSRLNLLNSINAPLYLQASNIVVDRSLRGDIVMLTPFEMNAVDPLFGAVYTSTAIETPDEWMYKSSATEIKDKDGKIINPGINISKTIKVPTSNEGALPFFSPEYANNIHPITGLSWLASTSSRTASILSIKSDENATDHVAGLDLIDFIGLQRVNTHVAHTLHMGFNNRIAKTNSTFKGLSILLQSNSNVPLSNSDTAIGLTVDMSKLPNRGSTQLPIEEDKPLNGQRYAAFFLSGKDVPGNVMIGPARKNPSANLHVVAGSTAPALWIDSLTTPHILSVTATGSVGIGTTANSTLTLEGPLRIATDTSLLFVATTNQRVGIGTPTPDSTLTLVNNTSTLLSLSAQAMPARFVVDAAGSMGIGVSAPLARAHLSAPPSSLQSNLTATVRYNNVDSTPISKLGFTQQNGYLVDQQGNQQVITRNNGQGNLEQLYIGIVKVNDTYYYYGSKYAVNTSTPEEESVPLNVPLLLAIGTKNSTIEVPFRISASGNIGITTPVARSTSYAPPSLGYSLSVSKNVLSGSSSSLKSIRALNTYQGFVAAQNQDFLWTGLNTTKPTILFGKTSADPSSFAIVQGKNSTEIMRLTGTGIGLGTSSPEAMLHVRGSSSVPIFAIDKANNTPILTVDASGQIGIQNKTPHASLDVSGNLGISRLVNAVDTGTSLTGKTMTLKNIKQTRNNNAIYSRLTYDGTQLAQLVGNNIEVRLGEDRSKNVVGLQITINAKPANTHKVRGIHVAISPSYNIHNYAATGVDGKVSAALFLGGAVKIGRSTRIPPSLLEVSTILDAANLNYNIAYFESQLGTNPVNRWRIRYIPTQSITTSLNPLSLYRSSAGKQTQATSFSSYVTPAQSLTIDTHIGQLSTIYRPDRDDDLRATGSVFIATSPEKDWETGTPINRVGFGFDKPEDMTYLDTTLVVAGNVKIGATSNATFLASSGYGSRLYFSGAPPVAYNTDGENGDKLWMARYNVSDAVSELRIGLSDSNMQDNPGAYFSVYSVTPNYLPLVSIVPAIKIGVSGYHTSTLVDALLLNPLATAPYLPRGVMGINVANPMAPLHVSGSVRVDTHKTGLTVATHNTAIAIIGPSVEDSNYVTFLYKPSASTALTAAQGIAGEIQYFTPVRGISTININGTSYTPTRSNLVFAFSTTINVVAAGGGVNRIVAIVGPYSITARICTWNGTTLSKGKIVNAPIGGAVLTTFNFNGTVQRVTVNAISSGLPGVRYLSSAGDYAEHLQKLDPDESIGAGDVVGVCNGKITKNTRQAQQIMVISTSPIVQGNWKDKDKTRLPVAFLGQVPVRVRGPVRSGDILIASEDMDGTAIAVPIHEITSHQLTRIVGRAWESTENRTISLIHTLVGMPLQSHVLATKWARLRQMMASLKEDSTWVSDLQTQYTSILSAQKEMLDRLKKKVQDVHIDTP